MQSSRLCCCENQTQGTRLTAIAVEFSIVSVMQLKRQQLSMSSTIPYFHQPHPGFAKSILWTERYPLCPFRIGCLEFCGEDACLPEPRLGASTQFTQRGEQLSDSNCFHPLTLSLCYLHITVISASLLLCGISASRCSQQFLHADLEQAAYQKSIF